MASTTCIILGVITIILSLIFLIIGLKENDFFFFCITGSFIVMAVLLFGLSGVIKKERVKSYKFL